MAIPDPYKAAKKSVGSATPRSGSIGSGMMNVPTAGGSVPAPKVNNVPSVGQSTPKTLGIPKSGSIPAPVQSQPKPTFSTPEYADWQAKTTEQYANLEKMLQTPFSYDPGTDAGYLAQRDLAQLRAGDATKNAMEAANEKGVFGSSLMTSQMGQIQQRAEQEAAAYIPVYREQAYGQHQDRLAQAANMLNTSRALRGDQFNEAVTEGELTGSYMSPQARTLLDSLFSLKSQAESPNITREARAGLSKQADGVRAQLSGLGIDSSQFGADVNLNSARGNMGAAGLSTLAKQAQDEGIRQFDESMTYQSERDKVADDQWNTQFEYTQGRDKAADEKWQTEFDRIKEQDGIQTAIAWANQSLNREEFADRSARDWAGLDFEMQNAGQQPADPTFTPNQVYSAITSKYGDFFDGTAAATPAELETMYQDVIRYGLPEAQENDILRAIGISDSQIASFDKKYLSPGN